MNRNTVPEWAEKIRQRYENYLKTSFYFMDPHLRLSFQNALQRGKALLVGPFPEKNHSFKTSDDSRALADYCFPDLSQELYPALLKYPLYSHQERAIRATHIEKRNVVIATGTASGKTECFLYPILFELYQQYLDGRLNEPGVRALILYPMNALANDQRDRLGKICSDLDKAKSGFMPTFGQYIGQTPENSQDRFRNAKTRSKERLTSELVFREEMRENPPHILLTNYSMLEYLLIRPNDTPLFDNGNSAHWQYIVLDEAHQYRGAKGMEMGMLIRRLKQRLRDGGRQSPFRCIATSATISSNTGEDELQAVAKFAKELFDDHFDPSNVIFSEHTTLENTSPRRYHAFLRALEGAFLIHRNGKDHVVLNRKSEEDGIQPLEIALCRECGQHYYVGMHSNGKLEEAFRDPSHPSFGVEYYFPSENGDKSLCRCCGLLSDQVPDCDCDATIQVKRCKSRKNQPDQLKKCENCNYQRGGVGDPVQEIVHGSDGPSAVIATALHELLPEKQRKILAFADSRQEAAFFAWYSEDSYEKVRDRNLILRAIESETVNDEGLSIDDLKNRLLLQWTEAGLFSTSDTIESKRRKTLTSILREILTSERRLSLSGVGTVKWFVALPNSLKIPEVMYDSPWNFTENEARQFMVYALDELRIHRALNLPSTSDAPSWSDVSPWEQTACGLGAPGKRRQVFEWGSAQSSLVKHFLHRILAKFDLVKDKDAARDVSTSLMKEVWYALQEISGEPVLDPAKVDGTFRLNPSWLRVNIAEPSKTWECDTCANVTTHNIRNICQRFQCPGELILADQNRLAKNHYRILYKNSTLPPILRAEEHTAQIDSDRARRLQDRFKSGDIHLLSSSTTFEVGVDLGDLDVVFLRNVPPEPFNYIQRVGRAGRREGKPGFAITYCRRNPHDMYHYENPEGRILKGDVHPPRLHMTNQKIILRHMVATAMSAFFRQNKARFDNVETFVGDWNNPSATAKLKDFCNSDQHLAQSLRQIVPKEMYRATGLMDNSWVDKITGDSSRLSLVEKDVCADFRNMQELREHYFHKGDDGRVKQIGNRRKTIARETTLTFLSRKAVIPKYGFPVDVVELETRTSDAKPPGISLQRDLSQAIAEYAPGGKVVANKLEWESAGIKKLSGKEWAVRYYKYDGQHNFKQWSEHGSSKKASANSKKYLIPEFGFVTSLFKKPKEPKGRAQRLYTTRPFFRGFDGENNPKTKNILGINITKVVPGILVVLCEGKNRDGFHICRSCGAHMVEPAAKHKSPTDSECQGSLDRFSLGHELITDVVRLQFPNTHDQWEAYSIGYAVLLGAAETLNVPSNDLNITITGMQGETAIVLYDNVPGGAGLVAEIEEETTFVAMLKKSRQRVKGGCGCDSSCYGCLRSYRNQFAHPHLTRMRTLNVFNTVLSEYG